MATILFDKGDQQDGDIPLQAHETTLMRQIDLHHPTEVASGQRKLHLLADRILLSAAVLLLLLFGGMLLEGRNVLVVPLLQ